MSFNHRFFAFGLVILLSICAGSLHAQGRQNDIPVRDIPTAVLQTLEAFVKVLSAKDLATCADQFATIAGGSLIQEDGKKLRSDVMPFSLKKDFSNLKFYARPLEITRVNKSFSNGDGYGETAIKGFVYKIWIGKKKGVNGMPAPISIMIPEGHATITTPKVIGIGSL
jgi:hypothetical protein